jgi:hypothetical protein
LGESTSWGGAARAWTSALRHWKSVDRKIETLHDTVRHAQEAAERVVAGIKTSVDEVLSQIGRCSASASWLSASSTTSNNCGRARCPSP